MRLLWILLPLLWQGTLGTVFEVQPEAEQVVRPGGEVTLECVTNEDVVCAWKTRFTGIGMTGFLLNNIPRHFIGPYIMARNSGSRRDCTIIISNIGNRYSGTYICSAFPSSGIGMQDSTPASVIVAKKPQSLHYLGEAAYGHLLPVPIGKPVTVQCTAEMAMPRAQIVWFLDNTQLYHTIEVNDTKTDSAGFWSTVSTLTYEFGREDTGKRLRCRANHSGYDMDDQEERETAVHIDVRFAAYRPGGNRIGRLYGFTAGRPGEVTVNFTANPPPYSGSWRIGDNVRVPIAGQTLDGRFRSGQIISKKVSLGVYAITLTIDPVELEDQAKTFVLHLKNEEGQTELEFSIGIESSPQGLEGSNIGGIVTARVILILMTVGTVGIVF